MIPLTCGPLEIAGGNSEEWPDDVERGRAAEYFPLELFFLLVFVGDNETDAEVLSLERDICDGDRPRAAPLTPFPDC